MPDEKMSAETAVMLTMQKLFGIAEELFDHIENKDDSTFMTISIAPNFIHCDVVKTKECDECGNIKSEVLADMLFSRKTKMTRWYK